MASESAAGGRVTFQYQDYRDNKRLKRMTLEADEFLRRYLQHVLPRGFVRLRGFGLMANCCRQISLDRCRAALGAATGTDLSLVAEGDTRDPTGECEEDRLRCPSCGHGRLSWIGRLPRPTVCELVAGTYVPRSAWQLDSS